MKTLASIFNNKLREIKYKSKHPISVDSYINNNLLVTVSEDLTFFGGVFNLSKDNTILLDILLDRGFDITDTDKCLSFLNGRRGKKVQRAKVRDDIIKPFNKWLKNRGLINNKSFINILFSYYIRDSSILATLDESKNYTLSGLLWLFIIFKNPLNVVLLILTSKVPLCSVKLLIL